MINFKVVRYKNLLSTGNDFIEVKLDDHLTTLIVGKNGSGKSTLLCALSFALYGKPFRKINKPQLINSITKKEMVVEVEFNVNNEQYKIVRGLKPAILEIYKNGELINQDAASKDYQEYLETHILKINYKSFCQVVVLGAASFTPFMQLTSQAKREIIEDLLDLQIFSSMNILLKDKILDNNNTIKLNQSERDILLSNLSLMRNHYETIQNSNEKFIDDKKKRIKDTHKEVLLLENRYAEIQKEGKILNEKLKDQQNVKEELDKIEKTSINISAVCNSVNKMTDLLSHNDQCPTCKQNINEEFKTTTIKNNQNQLKGFSDSLETLEKQKKQIKKVLEIFSKVSNELYGLNIELSQINMKTLNLNDNIKNWVKEINDIKNNNSFISSSSIQELENKVNILSEEYKSHINDKEVFSVISSLLKDGGIKSKIIKQYVPVINKLINKYLSSMDFFVNFELNEQFEETIKSRGRDDFSYMNFSEGEKLRIDLAILFTWRAIAKMRSSINTNLLIMDEIFDSSLDVNGADDFMNILRNIAPDNNVFIISHRTDSMCDKFDHVIKFEKIRNFSRRTE